MKKNSRDQKIKLSDAVRITMLSEGLFDKLMNFLASLTVQYYSGVSSFDKSRMAKTNVGRRGFSPGENLQDQLDAATCAVQLVRFSIDSWGPDLGDPMIKKVRSLKSLAGSNALFIDSAKDVIEELNTFAGRSVGALTQPELIKCSKAVYNIGKSIVPGSTTSDSLDKLANALSEIYSLQFINQAKKITKEKAAKAIIKKEPGLYVDVLLKDVQFLEDNFDPAIKRLKILSNDIKSIEDLIETKSQQPELTGTSDPVKAPAFESYQKARLRKIIYEVCNGN